MYPRSIHALQTDALFASALQGSDEVSIRQIRRAIAGALAAYGGAGCAGRVAQEFGDHPETATARMRWARAAVALLDGALLGGAARDGQPPSKIRRIPAADSSALGRNPAAGLSAIRSA